MPLPWLLARRSYQLLLFFLLNIPMNFPVGPKQVHDRQGAKTDGPAKVWLHFVLIPSTYSLSRAYTTFPNHPHSLRRLCQGCMKISNTKCLKSFLTGSETLLTAE